MQIDVDTVTTGHAIRLQGINAVGQESDNALICQGRTIPWLQDTKQANVWGAWSANWRDVVILDDQNKVVSVYNLTSHDLSVQANYDELRSMLLTAAGPAAPPP